MANSRLGALFCLSLLLLATLAACTPKSPEERVAASRARYTASLNGFLIQEKVVEAEPAVEEGEVTTPPGEEGEEMAPPEVVQNVLLDILVQHDSNELLPGVTVDIWQVDSGEVEKAHWTLWVDTDGLAKATATQVSHLVEDIDYVDGDGFYAEIRNVPAEERGDYPEFAASP